MADENRNAQNNSAESTVKSAVKTGKAVSNITRGAATGGIHRQPLKLPRHRRNGSSPSLGSF